MPDRRIDAVHNSLRRDRRRSLHYSHEGEDSFRARSRRRAEQLELKVASSRNGQTGSYRFVRRIGTESIWTLNNHWWLADNYVGAGFSVSNCTEKRQRESRFARFANPRHGQPDIPSEPNEGFILSLSILFANALVEPDGSFMTKVMGNRSLRWTRISSVKGTMT
jgi:hypothetical protein